MINNVCLFPRINAGYLFSSISPESYSGFLRPFPPSISSGFDPDLGTPTNF